MHESDSRHTLSFLIGILEFQSISIVIRRTYLFPTDSRKMIGMSAWYYMSMIGMSAYYYNQNECMILYEHERNGVRNMSMIKMSAWYERERTGDPDTAQYEENIKCMVSVSKFHDLSRRNELQRCEAAFRFPYLNIFPVVMNKWWFEMKTNDDLNQKQMMIWKKKLVLVSCDISRTYCTRCVETLSFYRPISHWLYLAHVLETWRQIRPYPEQRTLSTV